VEYVSPRYAEAFLLLFVD